MNNAIPVLKKIENLNFLDNAAHFERNGQYFKIEGVDESDWMRSFHLMDGTKTIKSISQASGIKEEFLVDLITSLNENNVIGFRDENKVISGAAFWKLHDEYSRGWLDKIATHPIWPALTEGKADLAVVIGFVIEKFHYIEAAYEHMALAAANADPRISNDLTRHFMEEYNHGNIYLGGLSALFPQETIIESLPLPSTRALVNCLNELAMQDSFSYYSANEFLQKTENLGNELNNPVETFYNAIERNYRLPTQVCRAMRAHTEQDQKLGHQDVFAKMCSKLGEVSIASANQYLMATKQIADHLHYFLDGILNYYSRNPYVPRPRPSMVTA